MKNEVTNLIKKLTKYILITSFLIAILIAAYIGALYYAVHEYYRNPYIDMLRTVWDAQETFKKDNGGYAGSWKELRDGPAVDRKESYLDIDPSGIVKEYYFALMSAGEPLTGKNGETVYTDFICIAEPIEYGKVDNRSFMIDSSGVIRFEYDKAASKDSGPI